MTFSITSWAWMGSWRAVNTTVIFSHGGGQCWAVRIQRCSRMKRWVETWRVRQFVKGVRGLWILVWWVQDNFLWTKSDARSDESEAAVQAPGNSNIFVVGRGIRSSVVMRIWVRADEERITVRTKAALIVSSTSLLNITFDTMARDPIPINVYFGTDPCRSHILS